MTTDTATSEVLAGNARTIKEVVDQVLDIGTLQELGRAERSGQNRAGVLNDIQNRIGERIMAGQDFSTAEGRALGGMLGDIVETVEQIGAVTGQNTADAGITSGTVTHRGPRMTVLYFKENDGWKPRTIPKTDTNIRQALARGAKEYCPDCGRQYCRVDTATMRFTGDMNGCSGRDPVPFMRCPVCPKRFFDHIPEDATAPGADPNEIKSERYSQVTPARRIESRLNQHLLAYHPQEAGALGLQAQSPRDRITGAAPPAAEVVAP